MHQVNPKAFFIAETKVNPAHMVEMLKAIGMSDEAVTEWWHDNQPVMQDCSDGETLVEVGGRLCYKSFEAGLNKNVTKVREGNNTYMKNILATKHGSVLEHATVSIAFIGVTRVFTHEIVRHRPGMAFSQESLRYVRLDDLGYRFPPMFENRQFLYSVFDAQPESFRQSVPAEQFVDNKIRDARKAFEYAFTASENAYKGLCDAFNIDGLKDFNLKKKLTSAFRRVAPIGLATNILITGNHRSWRHIIELRASSAAEEELVEVIGTLVAPIMKHRYPNIYSDMTKNTKGEWCFENSKV